MPVFPLVASSTVLSGVSSPDFSPASIIMSAGLSLIDPPGLKYSNFARIFTLGLGFRCLISTKGVFPIVSNIEYVIIFSRIYFFITASVKMNMDLNLINHALIVNRQL